MLAINYVRTLIAFVVAQVNTHVHLLFLLYIASMRGLPEFLVLKSYGKRISSSSLTSLIFNLAVNYRYGCSI